MGNKTTTDNKNDSDQQSMVESNITKVTLEGILINEDKTRNTKTIQLIDAKGNSRPEILTVSTDSIKSCIREKRLVKTPKSDLIISYWFRTIMENEKELLFTLVDQELISLVSKYASFEISVRLTRPLSLGIGNDKHHLHIRQIQIFGTNYQLCTLAFKDGSVCIKRPKKRYAVTRCIDGDTSLGSYNHNDFSNRPESNSQDHWMEFIINQEMSSFIHDIDDIGYIKIYNRQDNHHCMTRLQGSVLQLMADSKVVKQWTLNQTKREYVFYVNLKQELFKK